MGFYKMFKTPRMEEDTGVDIGGNGEVAELQSNNLEQPVNNDATGEVVDLITEKPVQSSEDNARFAAARREAEAEKKRLQEEREQDARDAGYSSYAELQTAIRNAKQERELEEKQERIDQYGYDPQELIKQGIDEGLKNHPLIKKIEQEEANARINLAIKDLNDNYGLGLKSANDLNTLSNADKIEKLLKAGFDIVEAYKMANYDTISQKQVNAAKQAAAASVTGRQHLGAFDGTPNAEFVKVPDDVINAGIRAGWSEEKIQTNYKLLLKSQR